MVAFFISYGKTFRIKNEMINYIEQNEGVEKDSLSFYVQDKVNAYSGKTIEACYNEIDNGSVKGFTVKVVVYMEMDRTILGKAFNVKIPVSGETRIIEKGYYISFSLGSWIILKQNDRKINVNLLEEILQMTLFFLSSNESWK